MKGLITPARAVPTLWQGVWARLGLEYMAYRARGPLLRFVIHSAAVLIELRWFSHVFRYRVGHQFLVLEALIAIGVGAALAGVEPLKAHLRQAPSPVVAHGDGVWQAWRRRMRLGLMVWGVTSVAGGLWLVGAGGLTPARFAQWAMITGGLLEVAMMVEALPISALVRVRGSTMYTATLEFATRAVVVLVFSAIGVWAFTVGALMAVAIRMVRVWWITRDYWRLGGAHGAAAEVHAGPSVAARSASPRVWSWCAALGGAVVRSEYLVIVLGYYLARRSLRFDLLAVLFATGPSLGLAHALAQTYALDALRAWRRESWIVWRRYSRHVLLASLLGIGLLAVLGVGIGMMAATRRGVMLGPTAAACAVAGLIAFGAHAMNMAWVARRYAWGLLGALAAASTAVAAVATIGGGGKGQLIFGGGALLLNLLVWWRVVTLVPRRPGLLEFLAAPTVQLALARGTVSSKALRQALGASPAIAHWTLPHGRVWVSSQDADAAQARLVGCLRSTTRVDAPAFAHGRWIGGWHGGIRLGGDEAPR